MTEAQKFELLVSPEKFFPQDLRRGSLLGNQAFISSVEKYLSVLSESQYWPKERLEEIQTLRLRKLTANIVARSKFWADYFHKNGFVPETAILSDLTRLPVLRRESILKYGEEIYVRPETNDEATFARFSGGTTGIPLKFISSERETLVSETAFHFRHPSLKQFSLRELFTRKPFVTFGKGFLYIFEKDFFFNSFQSVHPIELDKPEIRQDIYQSIRDAAPAFLVGYGSVIAKLAEWIFEEKVKLPILAVRTSSEPISSSERESITRYLGVPVADTLSSCGTGVMGFQCRDYENGFHIHSEKIFIEVVGENGKAVPAGIEGELVATSLSHTVTPIIRYGLNDMGRLLPDGCSCKVNLPLIEFQGRRGYEVIMPSGRNIRMIHFHNVLMSSGLSRKSKQIQLVQSGIDNLLLRIVPRRRFAVGEEANLRMALSNLLGGEKMNIDIEYIDAIPLGRGHKPAIFVSLSEYQKY